ncbi:MAG TPA: hypothetical protein VIK72_11225 [Clostridiaceae bacterium]
MMINAILVKQLREITGAGMMEYKKDLLYSYTHGQGRIGVILQLIAPKDNMVSL